jgi:hypothetical protein
MSMLHRGFLVGQMLAVALALPLAGSCNGGLLTGDPGNSDRDDLSQPDLSIQAPCLGLGCRIARCPPDSPTKLSGVVNIPAGNLPLYGARVYIPSSPLSPISHGPSCDRCTLASGNPLVLTTTDPAGKFSLEPVPSGTDIPLVIQVGKWRRQVLLASVPSCQNTQLDPATTRLPSNQAEGDLPQIALTTGGADALECLVRKLGIADSEITPPTGKGRVHLYSGVGGTDSFAPDHGGAAIPPASPWWDSLDNLKQYDVIVHSCEGTEMPTNKSLKARQALKDYIDQGGRVFASHWHNYWVEFGASPLPTVATFNHRDPLPNPIDANIDMTIAKGQAFAQWLVSVGASEQPGGILSLTDAKNTVQSVNSMVAQKWITVPAEQSIQYLSFDTPIGVLPESQCGRMVLSDIHVSADSGTSPYAPFPIGCMTRDLSPQEKALIFMIFDLSNCIAPPIG